MRYRLLIFIVISILLHLLVISGIDLSSPEKPEKRPVTISVIPKEKPQSQTKPKQKPQPKPPVKAEKKQPDQAIHDTPLNEEVETDVHQQNPIVANQKPEEKQAKGEKPQQEPNKQPSNKPLPELPAENHDIQLPKVESEAKISKDKLDGILNPDEIIDKYAAGGGMPEGEDFVSMQYVKIKYQSYFYKFSRRLYQVWLYPRNAAMRGEQGIVRIVFKIGRNGMISGINVVESSGYPDLDREAVTALRKTAGVPLPDSYELDFLKVDAYFQYILNKGFVVY